MTISRHLRSNQ